MLEDEDEQRASNYLIDVSLKAFKEDMYVWRRVGSGVSVPYSRT